MSMSFATFAKELAIVKDFFSQKKMKEFEGLFSHPEFHNSVKSLMELRPKVSTSRSSPKGIILVVPSAAVARLVFPFEEFPVSLYEQEVKKAQRRIWVWGVSLSFIPSLWEDVCERPTSFDLKVLMANPENEYMKQLHPCSSEHQAKVDTLLSKVALESLKRHEITTKFRCCDFPLYNSGVIIDDMAFLISHKFMKRAAQSECLMHVKAPKSDEEQFEELWKVSKEWEATSARLVLITGPPKRFKVTVPDESESESEDEDEDELSN